MSAIDVEDEEFPVKSKSKPQRTAPNPARARSPLVIRRVLLADLRADPNNVNEHGEKNLWAIRNSLEEFGQVEPLVVQKGTGRVIAGHGRLQVMRADGVAECDVVELEIDDVRASALAVALNRTAKTSEFDLDRLADLLEGLSNDGFDVESIGFSGEDVSDLIGRDPEREVKQIDVTPPPVMAWVLIGIPTVRFGEIAADIERIAAVEGTVCEVATSTKDADG